ncbi:MAG: hypothetical protein U0599_04255 [Vicinamibacteria bacterium]
MRRGGVAGLEQALGLPQEEARRLQGRPLGRRSEVTATRARAWLSTVRAAAMSPLGRAAGLVSSGRARAVGRAGESPARDSDRATGR